MALEKAFEKKSLRALIFQQRVQADRDAKFISELQRENARLHKELVRLNDACHRALRHASHGRAVAANALDLPLYRPGRRKALNECLRLFGLIESNEM